MPLIIHCREAQEDTLRILQEEKVEAIGGVFHCYAGDAALAAELRRMNFFVSFAGNITFKKALGLQEAVKLIPMEQILLETDTPYLAPEPFRGKESEPAHVLQTAQKIAELKEISLDQVAQVTTANAETLFGLQ